MGHVARPLPGLRLRKSTDEEAVLHTSSSLNLPADVQLEPIKVSLSLVYSAALTGNHGDSLGPPTCQMCPKSAPIGLFRTDIEAKSLLSRFFQ